MSIFGHDVRLTTAERHSKTSIIMRKLPVNSQWGDKITVT